MPQQQCKDCKMFFPFTAEFFRKTNLTKSGLNKICKRCNSNKANEWYRKNLDKKKPVQKVPCEICGKEFKKGYMKEHMKKESHAMIIQERKNQEEGIWV